MHVELVHATETFEKGNCAWTYKRDEERHISVGIVEKPSIVSIAESSCKRLLNCMDVGACMEHEDWTEGSLDVLSRNERQAPGSCNMRSE